MPLRRISFAAGGAERKAPRPLALCFLLLAVPFCATGLRAQTEVGVQDDLTVLGTDGTVSDPDVEIRGFLVVGGTRTSYPGSVVGPGSVAINGRLGVSGGADFAATLTMGGGLVLHSTGTASRPTAPPAGTVIFNTDRNGPEIYNGTRWMRIPVIHPDLSVTGGTVTYSGPYRLHAFTDISSPEVFSVSGGSLTADILLVGGGGGGGGCGGGGGAGGLVYRSGLLLSPGSYSVIVGAGGPGGEYSLPGGAGEDTVFGELYTAKGGGAGQDAYGPGAAYGDGGSGGGGGYLTEDGQGGNATQASYGGTGFGNGGGSGAMPGNYPGGGGGGAGGRGGSSPNTGRGGDAGAGMESYISGVSVWYAGGGAGGCRGSCGRGLPARGGGTGAYGGGGDSYNEGAKPSGDGGGQGIVIVRYLYME